MVLPMWVGCDASRSMISQVEKRQSCLSKHIAWDANQRYMRDDDWVAGVERCYSCQTEVLIAIVLEWLSLQDSARAPSPSSTINLRRTTVVEDSALKMVLMEDCRASRMECREKEVRIVQPC